MVSQTWHDAWLYARSLMGWQKSTFTSKSLRRALQNNDRLVDIIARGRAEGLFSQDDLQVALTIFANTPTTIKGVLSAYELGTTSYTRKKSKFDTYFQSKPSDRKIDQIVTGEDLSTQESLAHPPLGYDDLRKLFVVLGAFQGSPNTSKHQSQDSLVNYLREQGVQESEQESILAIAQSGYTIKSLIFGTHSTWVGRTIKREDGEDISLYIKDGLPVDLRPENATLNLLQRTRCAAFVTEAVSYFEQGNTGRIITRDVGDIAKNFEPDAHEEYLGIRSRVASTLAQAYGVDATTVNSDPLFARLFHSALMHMTFQEHEDAIPESNYPTILSPTDMRAEFDAVYSATKFGISLKKAARKFSLHEQYRKLMSFMPAIDEIYNQLQDEDPGMELIAQMDDHSGNTKYKYIRDGTGSTLVHPMFIDLNAVEKNAFGRWYGSLDTFRSQLIGSHRHAITMYADIRKAIDQHDQLASELLRNNSFYVQRGQMNRVLETARRIHYRTLRGSDSTSDHMLLQKTLNQLNMQGT